MKKLILLALMLISLSSISAQSTNITNLLRYGNEISKTKIMSKIALNYDSRTQASDTIYIAIKKWSYDTASSTYTAYIVDYVKSDTGYRSINEKSKIFSKTEVDGLFSMLNNSILPIESYSLEMDKLLSKSLLIDTQTNLFSDGKTVYGGLPANWELVTD